MGMEPYIEIQHNKSKLVWLAIGSLIFIGAGAWFFFNPPTAGTSFLRDPLVIKIISVTSVLFFGLALFIMIKKITDNKPALIISNKGILDNAGGVSAGHIAWKDITEIKELNVLNQRFLMVMVNNPEHYINKQTNLIKRKTMEMNFRSYGSPVSISAVNLTCNFNELKNILTSKLAEFGNRDQSSLS